MKLIFLFTILSFVFSSLCANADDFSGKWITDKPIRLDPNPFEGFANTHLEISQHKSQLFFIDSLGLQNNGKIIFSYNRISDNELNLYDPSDLSQPLAQLDYVFLSNNEMEVCITYFGETGCFLFTKQNQLPNFQSGPHEIPSHDIKLFFCLDEECRYKEITEQEKLSLHPDNYEWKFPDRPIQFNETFDNGIELSIATQGFLVDEDSLDITSYFIAGRVFVVEDDYKNFFTFYGTPLQLDETTILLENYKGHEIRFGMEIE